MTMTEQIHGIVDRYIDSGQPWPATARQLAAWAIAERLWIPHPTSIVDQAADQISRAMREEYVQDPQGRTVRAKHAARINQAGEQLTLWGDIRTADREFLEIAFQQRRRGIIGDCLQLRIDVDSFNENRSENDPIQLVLDFSKDVEERLIPVPES